MIDDSFVVTMIVMRPKRARLTQTPLCVAE